MSQNGWVKPDFGSASLGNSNPITKQQSGNMALNDPRRTKRQSEITASVYTPTSSNELVVQKKKIGEVKCWLEQAFSTANEAQFLLLTGPPGCGKYQTLSMICKELNIDILAWEEPIKHCGATEWDSVQYNSSYHAGMSKTDISFYDHLEEFLERASRFSTLRMKTEKVSVGQKATMRKVLLVKDFPPMILLNLERWHNILIKYGTKGKTPAIFILTNSKSSNNLQLKLFPRDLLEKLNMSTINFSGLANTFVLKALKKVTLQSQKATSHEVIQGIADSCNGDLRSAMNALYWINAKSNFDEKKSLHPKKRKLSYQRERVSLETAYVRDGSMDFMHAIGKILHSKRLSEVQSNSTGLPQHLLNEFRMPLKEDVNELTRNIGETSFKAIEYLSSVDSFCNQLVCKEVYEEYSLLTAIRGLMFSNTSVNGSTWRPVRKPDHFSVIQKQQELRTEMQQRNNNQCGPSFFSEIWPFTRIICSSSKITPGLIQALKQVDGHKSEEHPIRNSRTMAHMGKPMAFEDSQLPHYETTKPVSEEDADIVIEEYGN